MIQRSLHALKIVVFMQQIYSVDLAHAMRGDVLRKSESLCSPLYIRPNSLPCTML